MIGMPSSPRMVRSFTVQHPKRVSAASELFTAHLSWSDPHQLKLTGCTANTPFVTFAVKLSET